MTNAEVRTIIEDAATRGVRVDEEDAKVFLGAKEMLAADPGNELARRVMREHMLLINTGKPTNSFEKFMLPIFRTEEEIEEMKRRGCGFE